MSWMLAGCLWSRAVSRLVGQLQFDCVALCDLKLRQHPSVGAHHLDGPAAGETSGTAGGFHPAFHRAEVGLGAAVLHPRHELAAHRD